ncbi:MAG: RNA polymerase sigma factor [Bacteroidales bacterium]|nr:RNA polymerase sigma factor [Bacteroidales bacterium]
MTDKELIKAIKNNDQQAFKQFVENNQQLVVNICNGFLHNIADAEDITQDVFIEVFLSINKFKEDAKLSTWLYRIAVNKSLNHIRDNKKHKILNSIDNIKDPDKKMEKELPDVNNSQPEKIIEEKERSQILQYSINSLAKNQKIAFTLNKYDELSYKKIAEIMDISLSSVESLIHRAKKNLQRKLFKFYKKN